MLGMGVHAVWFRRFAGTVLLYHVAVILWGAFVRASGSGAGCGQNWPLCNGTVVPHSPQLATVIEFLHRITSGLAVLLVLTLAVWAFRAFPRRHFVRRAALFAVFFEFMEALLGAALVLLGYVAGNPAVARGYYLSLHLINTLMLLSALTLAAWAAGRSEIRLRRDTAAWWTAFAAAALLLQFLGVSGVIAALGDALFKSTSLAQGFQQDLLASAHPFVRLRVWHPVIAAVTGLGLGGLCFAAIARPLTERSVRAAWIVAGFTASQIAAGMINLALLAPIPLQIIHLFLADGLWIAFSVFAAEVLLESTAEISNGALVDNSELLVPVN